LVGGHRLTYRYDAQGNRTERAVFDTDGKPTRSIQSGTHRAVVRYDDRNRPIEERYFGTDDRPALHKDGYHRKTYRYDGAAKGEVTSSDGHDTPLAVNPSRAEALPPR